MNHRRILLGLLVLLVPMSTLMAQVGVHLLFSPQQWAFKAEEKKSSISFSAPLMTMFGGGLYHRTSERTTWGVDASIDLFGVGGQKNVRERGKYENGLVWGVDASVRTWEVVFHSEYESGTSLHNSFVFGPVVGVRSYVYDAEVYLQGQGYRTASGSRTVFPLGLRAGYRFDRNFVLDTYLTCAYQFGGGTSIFMEPEAQETRVLAHSIVQVSCAVGFRRNNYRLLR